MISVKYAPNGELAYYENGKYVIDEFIIQTRINNILRHTHNVSPTNTSRIFHDIQGRLQKLSHDAPPIGLINLENGLYNYKRHNLEPFSPELATLIQLNIWYEKDATCPLFDAFLDKIVSKEDKEENLTLIWEVVAYILIHGNPLQKAILFYGPGSNGKSTFINIMEALVGKNNCSNITLSQMSRVFEPAELLGKQLNTVGDLNIQFLDETETFKN